MSGHYIAFGIALSLFSILVAWMFISSRVRVSTRIAASLVAVALAVVMWLQASSFLGYPINGEPNDGDVIIDFIVLKPNIYLWVLDSNAVRTLSGGPRAYNLAYTKPKAEALFKARQAAGDLDGILVFHRTQGDDVVNIRSQLPTKH